MRRDRPLSLAMIRNLHRSFGIPAEVLIRSGKPRKKQATRAAAKARRKTAQWGTGAGNRTVDWQPAAADCDNGTCPKILD